MEVKVGSRVVHVDVTFDSADHRGLAAAAYLRSRCAAPGLAAVILACKSLLATHGLAGSPSGGLGTYTLALMVQLVMERRWQAQEQLAHGASSMDDAPSSRPVAPLSPAGSQQVAASSGQMPAAAAAVAATSTTTSVASPAGPRRARRGHARTDSRVSLVDSNTSKQAAALSRKELSEAQSGSTAVRRSTSRLSSIAQLADAPQQQDMAELARALLDVLVSIARFDGAAMAMQPREARVVPRDALHAHAGAPLVVLDPLNEGHNAAAGAWAFGSVQAVFSQAAVALSSALQRGIQAPGQLLGAAFGTDSIAHVLHLSWQLYRTPVTPPWPAMMEQVRLSVPAEEEAAAAAAGASGITATGLTASTVEPVTSPACPIEWTQQAVHAMRHAVHVLQAQPESDPISHCIASLQAVLGAHPGAQQ